MTDTRLKNWQAIQSEVLRRIHARDWPPGHTIPNEADLAQEFGCARATVNRALQSLADAGLLERRRKAGTRVAPHPVSKATVDIPVIRQEIEDRGLYYGYHLISCLPAPAPAPSALGCDQPALRITALHSGNGLPYVIEDRWINLHSVPAAQHQTFEHISANEWLLTTAPYTDGNINFTAQSASGTEAALLKTKPGTPVFVVERTTWNRGQTITMVRLTYAPGYSIRSSIGTGAIAM